MNILDSFSKAVRICKWKNKYLESFLKAFRNRKRKNKYYQFLRISYCARNSHATSFIQREQIIGQMAIAITLRGFNDLARISVLYKWDKDDFKRRMEAASLFVILKLVGQRNFIFIKETSENFENR